MKQAWRMNLGLIAAAAIAIVALIVWIDPVPPREITLATGAAGGAYEQFGQQLAARLAREGLTVHLQTTRGSVENLALLRAEDNDVSIALVQSGIESTDTGSLHGLGALFHEPLWIFTRRDFNLSSLRDLRGRRIAIGAEGSGVRPVALQVLELTGIAQAVQTEPLSGEEAQAALQSGAVDVAMFVASPESPFIRRLLGNGELKFHGLERVQAYGAALPRLKTIAIGEGQLDIPRNIPQTEMTLLSSVVTLVVNERFDSGLAPLLLEAARDVRQQGGPLERPGDFPSPRPMDFPLLREADHYHRNGLPFLMRFLPYWAATTLVRLTVLLVPLAVLLIPLFRVAPPLYRWRTRRKIFRWYSHLREIDERVRAGAIEDTVEADLRKLHALQDEIMGVNVPLAYADELYDLHLHIEWVIRRLEQLRAGPQT